MPEHEDLNIDAADRELVDALSRLTPSPVGFDLADVSFRHGQRSMMRQLRTWQGVCAASFVALLGLLLMQGLSTPPDVLPPGETRQADANRTPPDVAVESLEDDERTDMTASRARTISARETMLISDLSDHRSPLNQAGYDAATDDPEALRRSMLPEPHRSQMSSWSDQLRVLLGPGKS